jgi:hypothetical protein
MWFPSGWGGANPVGNQGGEIVPDRFDHEPITGYWSWHVTPTADGLALHSLHMPHVWTNPETAICYPQGWHNQASHNPKDAPHPDCSCGLYIQNPEHTFAEWEPIRTGKVSVFGTVELYGRVIRCERGYKAQHARIVSGYFEVSCAKGGCIHPVVGVQPKPRGPVLCWCTTHEPQDAEHPVVDADGWLREAADALTDRYGCKFFYWNA